MRGWIIISIIVVGCLRNSYAQLYIPDQQFYTSEIDRVFLKDSAQKTFFNSHLSLRPVLDKRSQPDSLYKKDKNYYYWITQKLFKENFLVFEGKGFRCTVDPILDLEGGTDLSADSLRLLYWNSRGLRVQAAFLDKIAFSTVFYENQAFLPDYVRSYVDSKGEFRPSGSNYKQDNAVIPSYARTKPFKVDGYDFAFAEGYVSVVPTDWINVQFGNGNQFIGNGYRSLFLSDFSVNYPFAKVETNLWNGRIQYNVIYAIHQNLYRMPHYNTVEATFERKIGTYHYLDIAVTPNLQIGLFEGSLWKRSDSLGSTSPNWLFTNPVPFVNGIIMANETQGYNAVFGMNYSWTFGYNRLYGQLLLDRGKFSGAQLGFRSLDLLTPGLDLQVELNYTDNFTYIAEEKRYNYSHYNLPLAHPLGAGFKEGILLLTYTKNEFFVSTKTVLYQQSVNDTITDGTDLLNDEFTANLSPAYHERNVLHTNLEVGYRLNKRYNLQAVIGWTYRQEQLPGERHLTNYLYAGIKTRLHNKTLDF
ncbi:MAG: hypothetical protein WDZ35_05115 [Crocinitomicaceae bacterium]